ncbi:MAG: AbrB/MazE/SpoVT family DNA-binding domain-containing protein [Candidatus Poseidoniaceae archaeon]|jgi:phosphate uptake regulator|nr:AbrB/MazE/SpoVT family DNA-binding domain-containing protein [Candidatus Poseidoniaceae archaeon]MDP7312167.1 AbrB/MazE/SpoVT family DNA-binding domain-containing protein [Candidatus Thalassarchaeaceae archaeon]
MDTRKAHRVGNSSIAITLPHEWVKNNCINPGDVLSVHEVNDDALLINNSNNNSKSSISKKFEVQSTTPSEHLRRLLIGSYIVGANEIEFFCVDSVFKTTQLEALNDCIGRLNGFLVTKQTEEYFCVQNYLKPTGTLFDNHLRQLLSNTMGLVNIIPTLIANPGNAEYSRKALALGDQSDIIYYLILRILLSTCSDRSLMIELGFDSTQEVVGGRLIAKTLEEICDRVEILANLTGRHEKGAWELNKQMKDALIDVIEEINELIEDSVDSYFSGSVNMPDSAIQKLYELEQQHFAPRQSLIDERTDAQTSTALMQIHSLIFEIIRLSRGIAEVSMNNSIRRM